MGGGDLNMKKSWHPVLLVNQERVWKAEKAANEEKKKVAQLRKEREEERQLAELQRLQEQTTGKKRVDKLDWMYAAPGTEGGALGGARIGEREMEDYLLGKRRVDEVLGQADKNVGNMHKDFIAVQNANTARDTASKIREDPLLAIKRQEQAALAAMANRPDIRRQLKALKQEQQESPEERKRRKRAEHDERKAARRDERERRRRRREGDSGSRTPPSRSDSEEDYRRRDRSGREDRDGYVKRERSYSPRRDPERSRRDESPRRYRDEDRSDRRPDSNGHVNGHSRTNGSSSHGREARSDWRSASREGDHRIPPPRAYAHADHTDNKPQSGRPSAADFMDRSTTSRPVNGHGLVNGTAQPNFAPSSTKLDDMRAARLAAMSSSADQLYESRTKALAQRAEAERADREKEDAMRKRYGKEEVAAGFFKQGAAMGLAEGLARRGGKGLQRDI